MKIYAKCSIVVKRAVKAVFALSIVIIYLCIRGINHLYDCVFLVAVLLLISKYYSIED